ncbi:MAG: DEAD/DEAH box helicase, partial [Salinivirgaceae bacterium]
MEFQDILTQQTKAVAEEMHPIEKKFGEVLFNNGSCQVLSQSASVSDFIIYLERLNTTRRVLLESNSKGWFTPYVDKELVDWNRYAYCALLQLEKECVNFEADAHIEHKQYTREGMIHRVLEERRQKASNAEYKIQWADNIFGDHVLTNEKGTRYTIFLRDFENEVGYSDSQDSYINKLGTTKHIMFAFSKLKGNKLLYNRLSKTFPFVEVYLDPLNEYKITWHYPHTLNPETGQLITKFFGTQSFIEPEKNKEFIGFLKAAEFFPGIKIRPEVKEKIERAFESDMLTHLAQTEKLDFSAINAELFPYQKEGVHFATFKRGAIIADEMGLGKTMQAFTAAIMKKKILGFQRTLIVCPASLKSQWKKEIEKFTGENAEIIEGTPEERAIRYRKSPCYFLIVNYETVLRDQRAINRTHIDFLILDEAQRVKNYATLTAAAIKNLERKHILVITGTPIENRLIDIFSIMSIIDPHFLGPLWEFSYQHCLFDPTKHNKINGYYNLEQLREELQKVLLRREKRNVIEQLPNIQEHTITTELSDYQKELHGSYSRGLSQVLHKRFLTQFDMQRIMLLLTSMRMVCDSSYLIDEESNDSPKLEELTYMLTEKLDIEHSNRKIIIFSEWVKVHKLLKQVLLKNNVKFVELNGTIPVKHRGELISKFENDPDCKVFLSTEAGGSGLNLQVADILINFELPWNPAKKNQRIGRIDR